MDGDVLYDRRVLEPLAETHHADCLLVDRAFEPGDEPVKVGVVDGAPTDFGKTIDPALDAYGESVGFFRLSERTANTLVETAGRMIEEGGSERPMEDAIAAILRAASPPFGLEDVTGLPWIEIDFPEDVARAETEILPKLVDEDG